MITYFFDLDGTLLPMDQDIFIKTYFKLLAEKAMPYGIQPEKLIDAVMAGTMAMIDNDGSMTNEERFWKVFSKLLGEQVRSLEPVFDNFYGNEFNQVKVVTSPTPLANKCIKLLKSKGHTVVLATNPLFPRIATLNRIKWAGLDARDFDLITTYENSSYCKPNLLYYRGILKQIGKEPGECIMIGNDVREDMCVTRIGMKAYLLKDCLINADSKDISGYRQGSFKDLMEYIISMDGCVE